MAVVTAACRWGSEEESGFLACLCRGQSCRLGSAAVDETHTTQLRISWPRADLTLGAGCVAVTGAIVSAATPDAELACAVGAENAARSTHRDTTSLCASLGGETCVVGRAGLCCAALSQPADVRVGALCVVLALVVGHAGVAQALAGPRTLLVRALAVCVCEAIDAGLLQAPSSAVLITAVAVAFTHVVYETMPPRAG